MLFLLTVSAQSVLAQSPGGVTTNLQRWYQANAGVTTATGVSQWTDQSGSGVALSQATAGNQPVYNTGSNLMNFNPSITFDGSNDNLRNATGAGFITGSGGYTVYYVASNSGPTISNYTVGIGAAASLNGFNSGSAATATSKTSGGTTFVTQANAWANAIPNLTRTGFTGGTQPYYLSTNGGAESVTANFAPNVAANAPLTVGAGPVGTANNWLGDIAEMIIYTGKHTNTDYDKIESYLSIKYGINKTGNYVNSSGSTIWTSGGGYDNNVAGIGRDDMGGATNSGLNQKQSQSQNSGNQVILGLSTIATSNATNTGGFASSNQFLIWGDNNTAGTTAFTSGLYTTRLNEVWKAQNTGGINQNVQLLIPAALISAGQVPALLYNTSPTFASGNQLFANAGTVTINSVSYYSFTLPAAQVNQPNFYFTLAYYTTSPGGVAGENLWLKADAGTSTTTTGTGVQTWSDQSGSGNDVTQATVANRPLYTSNGTNFNPALTYNGSSSVLQNTTTRTVNTAGSYTLFGMATSLASGTATMFVQPTSVNRVSPQFLTQSLVISEASSFSTFTHPSSPASNIYALTARKNGTAITTGSNGLVSNSTYSLTPVANDINAFEIGARTITSTTMYYSGNYHEMITYPVALSDADKNRVESYLSVKYGAALGSTTSPVSYVASDGTTTWAGSATYQNNVAGIGRDDLTALYLKQSQSQNAGSQVVMALGTVAATNLANGNTISADKQFFMWGDDAASLKLANTGNSTYPYRFTRVWKTQNTNSFNQNISVYYPVSAFGNAPAATVSLLYGSSTTSLGNGTAAAIAQTGTTTINSASYYIFTVPAAQLANMQFFSFTGSQTSPGGVLGAELWLKADAGTSTIINNTGVSQWNDQSGNSNNVLQGTAASQPTYRSNSTDNINFNPVLNFSGSQSLADANGILGGNNYTNAAAFVVSSVNALTNSSIFSESLTAGTGTQFDMVAPFGNAIAYWDGAFNSRINAAWGGSTGVPYLWTGWNNSSLTPKEVLRRNGSQIVSGNTAINYTGNNTAMTIGNAYNGQMGEVICYTTALTATQRSQVESYMAIKYGITIDQATATNYLDGSGSTIWNAVANSGYKNNIAGIGRDDLSALNQKQSQSTNTGNQVILGLSTIVARNAANGGNFTIDKQFLIWGDNNTSGTTAFTSGLYTTRLNEVWKAQNTNNLSQDVQVLMPAALISTGQVPALLYSTSPTFASGNQVFANTGTVTINSVSYYSFTLPAAQVNQANFYFTLTYYTPSPGGVPGASIWLKANQTGAVYADGAGVSSWKDCSLNQKDVVQATAANQPLYKDNAASYVNFNPVVTFDGATDYLSNTAGLLGNSSYSNATVFTVAEPSNTGDRRLFYEAAAASDALSLRLPGSSSTVRWEGSLSTVITAPWTSGAPYLWTGWNNNSLANQRVLAQNGKTLTAKNTIAVSFTGNNSPLYLGARTGTAEFYTGDLPEFIYYTTAISATEKQQVESYLAIKYGITIDQTTATNYLDGSGSTIWGGAANAAHNNNIAGIGRDDISGLAQLQSQSINSGNQVILGLNTIVASNAANTGSFTTDKQFLIWGDNGTAGTTAFTFGVYNTRLSRVWKAQNTGSINQDVQVLMPVALANAPLLPGLLYSTSPTFASGNQIFAKTGTVTINSVSYYSFTLPAAQVNQANFYFTLATFSSSPGGVTGATLWLRADAGVTTAGSNVGTWTDQSGNAAITTQPTIATPTSAITLSQGAFNFNPALNFTGASAQRLVGNTTGAANFSGSLTIYGVAQRTGALTDGTGVFETEWKGLTVNNSYYAADGNAAGAAATANTPGRTSANPQIASVQYTADNTTNTSAFYNGGLSDFSTAAGAASTPIASFEIGGRTSSTGFPAGTFDYRIFKGLIPEVINYKTSTQTTLERQRINSYLGIKYGITLSLDNNGNGTDNEVVSGAIREGDYVASDGATVTWAGSTTYQNNVAGIGRDDLTVLNQKQSQSVNTGSQVVMALGTVAATNQANSNTITSDKQFLIWGDDSASLIYLVATGNTTYPYRFTRVWKAQNTNSFAQNITVYYPVSAFTNAQAATVSLLYGTSAASLSNGTATAIAQSSTTTINGASYYVFTVPAAQVTNMQFFSFTGTQTSPGGVGGTRLWYRADNGITLSGTNVSGWQNNGRTGTEYNAVQATATNQPAYNSSSNLFNFNPTITFDGTNDRLQATGSTTDLGYTNHTIYSASKLLTDLTVTGDYSTYLSFGPASLTTTTNRLTTFGFIRGAGSTNYSYRQEQQSGATNLFKQHQNIALTPLLQTITGFTYDSLTNAKNTYENSLAPAFAGASGSSPRPDLSSNVKVVGIGARYASATSATAVWDGASNIQMGEIIEYDTVITNTQRRQIESYMAIKYGQTLGTTSSPISYLTSDSTVTSWTGSATYQNNVAGIGRDDLTALYQKQSQSINTGTSQVVMALGTVATTNQANSNTITSDKQFLIWGDDNGSLTTTASISGFGNAQLRLTRVWALQNTGSFNQSVTVYFPTADLATALRSSSNKYLVYDNTAGFNGTAKTTVAASGTATINGTAYTAFTVSFATTGTLYFSFGATGEAPVLTAASAVCSGTGTYSVTFNSNGTVTASAGTVSGNTVSGIPTGTNVILTATALASSATTQITVASPTSCPAAPGCVPPSLTAGQGVCNGGTYSVAFSATAGSTITTTAGTVSGNTITGIPGGTNVMITAALAAGCNSIVTVNAPADCSTPCATPSASFSAGTCSGATYTVNFVKTSTSVVTASTGSVTGGTAGSTSGTISGVATTAAVTATVTESGCSTQTITISAPSLTAPTLTAGSAVCSGTGTYSVTFASNGIVTASAGTVSGTTVSGIPTGTNVTLTAKSTNGCATTTAVVTSPASCPNSNGCVPPSLTAGNGICNGGGVYSVVFSASAGATITTTTGTISGNTITGILTSANVTITATLAAGCSSSVTVNAPADCSTPCATPSASFSAGTCSGATYTVNFVKTSTSVVTASTGTVTGGTAGSTLGTISGIATNTAVTATVTEGICSTQIITISAPSTAAPVLTAGSAVCSGTGTYSVTFNSNGIVTASAGTVSGNTVTGIATGTNVTLTAKSTNGCGTTTAVVTSPTSCPATPGCVPPSLTAGNGVCNGGGVYSVVFSASAGATITTTAGTISGNTITGILTSTNVTITATLASGCSSSVTVNAPADCSTPCATPSASFSAGTCSGATYTVNFVKTSTSIVTASTGTVTGGTAGSTSGTISSIATTTAVTATVTESGCSTQIVTISAPSVTAPILTAGNAICTGSGTYSVSFNSNGIVTASAGTVSGNTVINIPFGTGVLLTATSTNGCRTTRIIITSPTTCPGNNAPVIAAGQGVCSGGGTYSVVFSVTAGSVVTTSAGTVSGNTITGIPLGTLVTITATLNGEVSLAGVASPADCSTPCATPSGSFSAGICSGATYTVNFVKTSTSTVTATTGTVTGGGAGSTSGTISSIAGGTAVTATTSEPGCSTQLITISAPSTAAPVLTAGSAVCSGTGTYSVTFSSNGFVTASAGTVSGNTVTGIATGTNVTLTATSANGCATTTAVVTSPASCPNGSGCVPPSLTAGNGVCNGGGVYSVVFSATAGATITTTAGTVSGNTITGILTSANVTITATLAAGCSSSVTVNAPADCSTPCATPSASFSAGTCSGATYTVNFVKTSTSVVTASTGTVTGGGAGSTSGTISSIATGTSVDATVTESGCSTQIITISAPSTAAPVLTAGSAVCNGTGTYSVTFTSNGIVTASAGTVSGNTVTDIPTGTNVTLTAKSTNGCGTTTAVVNSPSSCPNTPGCVPPGLTAGNGVCNGGGVYSVVFSASAGATITTTAGTVTGNTITGIPTGTNVMITATLAAGCNSVVIVNAPADCSTPCATPSASFSAGICSGATYTVNFVKTSTSTVTASTGTVTGGGTGSTSGTISGVATGTAVTATTNEPGCSSQIITIKAPSTASPILTAGNAVCSGSGTYSVTFNSNGIVTASAGTISGNIISGIPTGTNVLLTATSTNGCGTTTAVVKSPTSCPATGGCVPPALAVGNGVCNGGGVYSVTVSGTGTLSTSIGTLLSDRIINIPVGTNVAVTSTADGGCTSVVTVNSPADCSTPCATPSASFSAGLCDGSTYSVSFIKTSTSTITAPAGTVVGGDPGSTRGTIVDIPNGTVLTATVTESGCSTQEISISAPDLAAPTLTVANPVCSGNGTYSVSFSTNGLISVSNGTISGNTVTGIPIGTNLTIAASSTNSCGTTTFVVTSPAGCPGSNGCVPPGLSAGNGVCNGGGTYSVAFSASAGATITASSGTVSGNTITGISITNDVVITATLAAGCSTSVTVRKPEDCSTPCATPSASFSAGTCAGTTYSVNFVKTSTSTVTATAGTVTGGGAGSTSGTISGVTAGTTLLATTSEPGCSVQYSTINPPSTAAPVLTAGNAVCSGAGTYSVTFTSNGIVTASAGTVSGNTVTGIPTGSSVTLTATSTTGCGTTTTVVSGPASCPLSGGCVPPALTAGQGVCNGGGVYSVAFSASASATVTASAGTVSGNTITGIPTGINVTIIATLAAGCNSVVTVNSPADCSTPCATPSASFSAGTCSGATYNVSFVKTSTSTVTASTGTVTGGGTGSTSGTISGVATGVAVTATITESGCSTQIINISAPSMAAPILSTSSGICSGTGTYKVVFNSSGIVTASAGTISGNTITGIPTGTDVLITAISTNNCSSTSVLVNSPTSCPAAAGCTPPFVTAGNGICNGTGNYSVAFTADPGSTVTASAGTVSGNSIINIPIGNNVLITATAALGSCTTLLTVNSPADCSTACVTPSVSFSQPISVGTVYKVYFTKSSTSVITSSSGTVTGGVAGSTSGIITAIPVGTNILVSVSEPGCSNNQYTISGPSVGGKVILTALLQGAMSGTTMTTTLNTLNLVPLSQPYNFGPFNYAVTESVAAIPANVTDWVLVELRDAAAPATVLATRAAFILKNGSIVDLDGTSPVSFSAIGEGSYYVSVRHRNHLGIRTAAAQYIDNSGKAYDFTTSQSSAYQNGTITSNAAMVAVSGGKFALWGGNANSNANVRYSGPGNDQTTILNNALGGNPNFVLSNVYNNADLNMNGTVRYSGPNNEQNYLLNTILVGNPNFIINQHL